MKRFKNILLGLKEVDSTDEHMLERVGELARTNGAQLKLMSVVEEVPGIVRKLVPSLASMDSVIENQRTEHLRTLCERMRKDGVDASFKVTHGKPFVEIIREVSRDDHDICVVAAHEPGNGAERFFGSTAQRLLRKCPCALWVFKPGVSTRLERIMVAVDPLSENLELNIRLLELADSLALIEKAELYVSHAWNVWAEHLLRRRMSEEELPYLFNNAEREVKKSLTELLSKSKVIVPEDHILLVKGEPEKVIPESLKENQIDLLTIGTVARTGVPGLIMGNTAERLLEQVECSVLAIKPEGFVSPVT